MLHPFRCDNEDRNETDTDEGQTLVGEETAT